MTKADVLKEIDLMVNLPNKKEIKRLIGLIPNPSPIKFLPTNIKQGDIYFAAGINHHVVMQKVRKDDVVALLLTSSGKIPCNSRFAQNGFSLTLNCYTKQEIGDMVFSGVYANNAHLNKVYKEIKNKM